MKFIDNFLCGIGNIFVKFHQESYLLHRILKYNDFQIVIRINIFYVGFGLNRTSVVCWILFMWNRFDGGNK